MENQSMRIIPYEKDYSIICVKGTGAILKANSLQGWSVQKPVSLRTKIYDRNSQVQTRNSTKLVWIKLKGKQKTIEVTELTSKGIWVKRKDREGHEISLEQVQGTFDKNR